MVLCEHKPYGIDGTTYNCSINIPLKLKGLEIKNPCKVFGLQGFPFGCPDGLEPSTFRTTI